MGYRYVQFLAWSFVLLVPFTHSFVGSASEHGTRIHISPIESPLSGDVNITFWFPPGLSADGTERVVTVNVYYFAPAKRRVASVATRLANKTHLVVSIRCDYFDQQGRYQFGYRLSESGISGTINQTLFLRWSKLRIDSPRNHTALTKFGSIWIHHDRKCLPGKYRDKVYLYYTRGEERVTITSKVVRKLYNGRQKEDGLRVRFSCELFDTQGNYFFEYVSGAQDGRAVLARSKTMQVTWSKHSLSTPIKSIIPCNNTFTVTFTAPECRRTTDTVELYEQNSGKFIAEKLALPGHNTVFYPCTLFSDYVKGYCFKYVTKALFTKRKTIQATLCVPTLKPGHTIYDGWSAWTTWGMCYEPCGKGKQYRYRFCLSLSTSQDKKYKTCQGKGVEHRPCYVKACPETTDSCSCGCTLTSSEGMFTSSPQLFPSIGASSCEWRINVKTDSRIKFWFDALQLEGDWIRIRDGNDSNARELAYVTKNGLGSPIVSSNNAMFIRYYHNGKWTNGTRRGFTASYTIMDKSPTSSKSFRKAELSFLGIFVVTIVLMGVVLLVVFRKLHRQSKLGGQRSTPHPAGSTSTSESTLRSTCTSSPLDDEASSNEPLRGERHFERKRNKRKRHRSSRGKEYPYDSKLPRCSCAEVSELESFSVTNSASRSSGNSSSNSMSDHSSPKRACEEKLRAGIPVCNCPQCYARERRRYSGHEYFGAPEKKYFGDWMVALVEHNEPDVVNRNWRNSYPRYV